MFFVFSEVSKQHRILSVDALELDSMIQHLGNEQFIIIIIIIAQWCKMPKG